MKRITIIGLGNMGGSLARGLLGSTHINEIVLSVYDHNAGRLEAFKGHPLVEVREHLGDLDIGDGAVILCVKPQDLSVIAKEIKVQLGPESLVISILAGQKIEQISSCLGFGGAIIRAMPNIAATVGCAATAMAANASCIEKHRRLANTIFGAVGEAYWTKESLMDVVTGLSGSGPAYIYMVIEALTDGGVKMGMPRDLAAKLATQTVLGAAKLVKESGLHPALLKDQVTTPAGTTISALVELESHGLRSMFVSAVVAATERSRDLGRQARRNNAESAED